MKNNKFIYNDKPGNVYFDDPHIRDIYLASSGEMQFSLPYVNVVEKADQYIINVLSPGVDIDNLDISIVDRQLVIKSKGKKSKPTEASHHLLREFSIPAFVRTIEFPPEMNYSGRFNYELDKGVLSVYIMK